MKKTVIKALMALIVLVVPATMIGRETRTPRVLVAYYSKSGNTQKMAECIAKYTGGDLYRIEPAVPYPENRDSFVARAKEEKRADVRIELKKQVVSFDEYDVVFIGSPVWFGDWAAPAASFARDERLAGKRVIPFMTSGRDQQATLDLLYKKYVKTNPEQGLCIVDDKMDSNGENEVLRWVCGLFDMQNCGELTTMNVMASLMEMKCRYPKITLCDVYKSLFQDYFGAGHIINNKKKAMKYIKEELKQVDGVSVGRKMVCRGMRREETGMEKCGALGRYVRVDLWKIKSGEMKINDYVDVLVRSVETEVDTAGWLKEWSFVLSVMQMYRFRVDNFDADLQLIESRIKAGEYGMHHSRVFNECYHPHYRIIKRELLK